ncbi:unnamed protein product, partial [Mesorhabditis spiculigera]
MSSIKAVVFDFGGVIMSYKLVTQMIESIAQQIGIPIDAFLEKRSELWNRFEKCFALMRGEITAEEFEETVWLEAIKEVYGVTVKDPIRWLTVKQKEEAKLNECMLSLILDLRAKGLKTALLSNCFFMERTKVSPILPIDYGTYFDVVIESCQDVLCYLATMFDIRLPTWGVHEWYYYIQWGVIPLVLQFVSCYTSVVQFLSAPVIAANRAHALASPHSYDRDYFMHIGPLYWLCGACILLALLLNLFTSFMLYRFSRQNQKLERVELRFHVATMIQFVCQVLNGAEIIITGCVELEGDWWMLFEFSPIFSDLNSFVPFW